MSDRPADPDGDGPTTTGGPKPSIADVASWLRRAAEERDTGDPSTREGATAGVEGGTEAPTHGTMSADEPKGDGPTDPGDGPPVEPGQAKVDDQVATGAALAPEAPAVQRPTGPAGRPARDLWGRLLPVSTPAGTDDSAGRPQSDPSTSTGHDQASAPTQGDVARIEDDHEGLAATGLGEASVPGTDDVFGHTARHSDGTPADTILARAEPAADDLGTAGRTSTADQPGMGGGGGAGGTRPGHVLPGPADRSDLPLADTSLGDSPPGGPPSSHGPLGDAEVGDDGTTEARGGEPEGPPVGLVPGHPRRDDRGGDDPGEPVDRSGLESVGLQETAGAADLIEAAPDDQGHVGQEAGGDGDDELPAPDLVPSDRATADTADDAAHPVDVVAPTDDQDQGRQVPGGGVDDKPATHLVPDHPSPPPDTKALADPSPWRSPFATDAARSTDGGAAAPAAGATGEAASDSLLGDEARPEARSEPAAEAELAPPVEANLSSTVDGDQEGSPAAGAPAPGDGQKAGPTPEPPPTDGETASAPAVDQAPQAAPRLAGIWTRRAPPWPVDVEDHAADRDGRRDEATEQDGRGEQTADRDGRSEQATMSPAGPTELDERASTASDDGDDPAGSEAAASVATLEAGEDGPVDPEWSAGADGGIVTGDVEMDDADVAAPAEPTPQSPVATAVAQLRRRHAAKRKRYPRGQLKERIGILQRVRAMLGVVLLTVILGVAAGAAIGAFLFFVAFAIRSAITSS